MKSHARVVIVGGGIMGVGLLYHLVQEGWTDVVLVEKGELTSGSTWHAAGQCPHFVGSLNLAKIHHEGTLLYPKLEELTGEAVSWHGCGGIRLAITDEEVEWFKRVYGVSKLIGYEAHLIGPDEIREHHPYLETFGVKMGYMTVTDGHVAPADVTNAMAAGARKGGAEIYRRTLVTDIELLPTGEWKVITDKGNIVCQHVVNAAGSYADVVGAWTGHNVPICNMLHHYIITEPLQELIDLQKELPVVRDPYSHAYLREETNGVLVGPYETEGAHVCWDGMPPAWDFESELITPELDRLMPWLEKATERMPLFRSGRHQVGDLGRHHPHAGRQLPAWPRTRTSELLDGQWRVHRHLPGCWRRQVPGAVDGAWRHRHQHGRVRPAPLRQLGGQGLRGNPVGGRLPAHVLLLPARRAAYGQAPLAHLDPV